MADNKAEKINKEKSGRVPRSTVVMVLVLILIGAYIFYEAYSATHVEVQTITAVTSTVYDTIDARALVIRKEQTIGGGSGVTVACAEDGEKVKVNGNIAMTFSSEENAEKYSKALDIQKELDYYIDLESKSAGTATDIAGIDKDIINDTNDYIRRANSYSSGSLVNSAMSINDKLTRRQIIIGQAVDISSVKADLQKQLNDLNVSACSPTGYITTERSGVFSSYTDGCEELFDYDNVRTMDIKTLDEYFKRAESASKTECFGKLITDYEWYFCCRVTADSIKNIKNGDKLSVALKDSDNIIVCTVVSGADVDLGVKETVLVLKSTEMNGSITSMRIEDIEIRYNEYTGFRVPADAVHINDDGDKVVYALIANQVEERRGKIIYSTKDYVMFEYEPQENRSIRLYDQIITQGKDLHDGKVYT